MTPRPRRPWSKVIEEAGLRVRVYEMTPGSMLYREVRDESGKHRKTLGHRDRALAEEQARQLAQRLAEIRFAGVSGAVTFGQLTALFRLHRLPQLSTARQRSVKGMLELMERHFPRTLPVDDLTPQRAESYVLERQSGRLRSPRHRGQGDGVRAGTIRNELHLLRAIVKWGQGHRVAGKRLITVDPLVGLAIPNEKNPKRPVSTDARYRALLRVADRVDPLGRFRCMLVLAHQTGRRINAICSLTVDDVLRTMEQLERALGAAGMDMRIADAWPHGALRWSHASDKLGFEAIAPMSREARAAVDTYLRAHPRLGTAPLFPATTDDAKPAHKVLAGYWLKRAEVLAKLPHTDRGGWHMLRRGWASSRRHLPAQDVAAAGGWRSIEVMQQSYQQADAATVLSVVERAIKVPRSDQPRKQATPHQ